jgi:NTE family protein
VEYTGSPQFRRWRDGLGLARRTVLKVVEQEGFQGADLASYLLFDGGFAEILIDLGRRDARALQDEWIRFWDEEPSCAAEAAQREE